MISSPFKWCIGKCSGLCTLFYQNQQMLPNDYALSSSYLDFWDTLVSFHVYAQTVLWWL